MGLLDLPAPILLNVDRWLAALLPAPGRLLLWAAVGALLSMELYRLLSPQRRIIELKLALKRAEHQVAEFDGEFADAWPYLRRMLSLALARVFVVLPATILASLPLLVFLVWMDTTYGDAFPPPGRSVSVQVPGEFEGRWVDRAGEPPRAQVVDGGGAAVADVPLPVPVSTVHKWRWWNAIIGNPAGYLPDTAPIDRISIDLPRQEILPIGPRWLRGWEVTYLAALMAFALAFKRIRRIA